MKQLAFLVCTTVLVAGCQSTSGGTAPVGAATVAPETADESLVEPSSGSTTVSGLSKAECYKQLTAGKVSEEACLDR
jgi:hypothetical protein